MNRIVFALLVCTSALLSFMCSSNPGAPPVEASGLVAFYSFSGNTNDESGNGYNGIPQNNPDFVTDRFGNLRSAYALNGNAQGIELPDTISIALDLSISFWMMTTASDTANWPFGMFIIDRDICGYDRDWSVGMGRGGKIQFNTGTPDIDLTLTSNASVNDGSWKYVVVVRDAESAMKYIYINGVLDASVAFDREPYANDDLPIYVGASVCSPNGHTFYEGSIDDIQLYNEVLTPAQIQWLYHEGGWGK